MKVIRVYLVISLIVISFNSCGLFDKGRKNKSECSDGILYYTTILPNDGPKKNLRKFIKFYSCGKAHIKVTEETPLEAFSSIDNQFENEAELTEINGMYNFSYKDTFSYYDNDKNKIIDRLYNYENRVLSDLKDSIEVQTKAYWPKETVKPPSMWTFTFYKYTGDKKDYR